jgi:polysaccharide pyruvyl transferase CsaB
VRFLVSGYYGFGNAGDELILRALCGRIKAKLDGSTLTVLSADPKKSSIDLGINAVNRWNPVRILAAMIGCDRFISGGGGLFQDRTGSLSLYYYLFLIALAKVLGKKIIICGAGISELKGFNKSLTAAIFKLAERITVRDEASRDLLISWGCSGSRIEATADILFLENIAPSLKPGPDKSPVIAFVLRKTQKTKEDIKLISSFASNIIKKFGAKVIFLPFQPAVDLEVNKEAAELAGRGAEVKIWNNIDGLIADIRECDILISQRFHGLVLAALLGIPFAGIYEDSKIERFLKLAGQKDHSHEIVSNNDAFLSLIGERIRSRVDFVNKLEPILTNMKVKSMRNIDVLYN